MASNSEKSAKRLSDGKNSLGAKGVGSVLKKCATSNGGSPNQSKLDTRKNHLLRNGTDCTGPIVHEAHILEAIDQMRKRKARPDVDRICNYMLKHYRVDVDSTVEDLSRLIIIEKVIEVDYKGNTSYRNASKWTKLQTYKQSTSQGMVKDKINLELVTSVISDLVIEDPDCLDNGVPSSRLIEHLLNGTSNATSKRIVKDFLNKQVSNGNVVKLSNGNFSLTNPKQSDRNMINNVTSTTGLHQQNGDSNSKIKSPPISLLKGSVKSLLLDGNHHEDYNLNTIKASKLLQKSPDYFKMLQQLGMKNEIADNSFGDVTGKLSNGSINKKDENLKQNGKFTNSLSYREEFKNSEPQTQQKKSKAERKQRLCVRSDDSTDILFKFDDDTKTFKDDERREYFNSLRLSDEDCDQDAGRDSANPSPTNANSGNFRSARRKRAKKVFDPSDNMVVKKKRGRQPNVAKLVALEQDIAKALALREIPNDPNRHCSLCSKDKQEPLVACRDCTVRAHPSCIYSPEEVNHKTSTSWQCERCKTCIVCYETSEAGPLVSCYNCDDAYHHSCHSPRIPASKTKWFCNECNNVKQFKLTKSSISYSNNISHNNSIEPPNISRVSSPPPLLSPPRLSPIRHIRENIDDDNSEDIDPNIPDASDWTVEQVYQYFARFLPKQAEAFRNEQIDGPSLMLLKRADVVQVDKSKGLGFLLGPGLKVWRHVLKLQLRKDDPKYYWL